MLLTLFSVVTALLTPPDSAVRSPTLPSAVCVQANYTDNVTRLTGLSEADVITFAVGQLQAAGIAAKPTDELWKCDTPYIVLFSATALSITHQNASGGTDTVALAISGFIQLFEQATPSIDQTHWYWMERWDFFSTWTGYDVTVSGGAARVRTGVTRHVMLLINHLNGRDDLNP